MTAISPDSSAIYSSSMMSDGQGNLPPAHADPDALLHHNRNMRLHAECDARCGLADCRAPFFDDRGLTAHRHDPYPLTIRRPWPEAVAAAIPDRSPTMVLDAWATADPLPSAAYEAFAQLAWATGLDVLPREIRLGICVDLWVLGFISDPEFRSSLPTLWCRSEPDDRHPIWTRVWIEAARDGRIEQTPLPGGDQLIVYRGESMTPYGDQRGIAWSLDRYVAEDFAGRYGRGIGAVWEGVVAREDVLAYITERDEAEVVVPGDRVRLRSLNHIVSGAPLLEWDATMVVELGEITRAQKWLSDAAASSAARVFIGGDIPAGGTCRRCGADVVGKRQFFDVASERPVCRDCVATREPWLTEIQEVLETCWEILGR